MKIYVSANTGRSGDGSKERPFKTISEAALLAQAGDEVLVLPGVYRERVNPRNGGTDERNRIIYRSVQKGEAIITGAEVVRNWEHYEGDVWRAAVLNSLFAAYNPYLTYIAGDWYSASGTVHTGEVYLNGKSMYEAVTLDDVRKPEVNTASWEPEFTKYKWYTCQENENTVIYANFQGADPNSENIEINVRKTCFYPEKTGINYITLSGFTVKQAATQWAPPTAYQEGMIGPHWSKGWIIEDCEVSDSKCSGISLGKYLQPENENKWTMKFCKDGTQTEREAVCQAQAEGWRKETIGSHIIRRCEIHDCGQTGIVGHMGGVFSLIEDNHIHHINHKQNLQGAEIGGIKMHAAIDVIYRRNHIHHCTRGIWLDWQAQGTRVTQNLFHDNTPPAGTRIDNPLAVGEDIFVEVSHGPTLIDHNLLLSHTACHLSAQGIALIHNLIAGSFTCVGGGTDNSGMKFQTARYTPYHMHHRTEIAGFMTILHGDARFYNNIFVQPSARADLAEFSDRLVLLAAELGIDGIEPANFQCGTKPYDDFPTPEDYFGYFTEETARDGVCRDPYYDHLPVCTGGNVYFNGAMPCNTEKDALVDTEHKVMIELLEKDGQIFMRTNLYEYLPRKKCRMISTEVLGMAFEPEQRFEQPDGTPIVFNTDYQDIHRDINPVCGPFENISGQIQVWNNR